MKNFDINCQLVIKDIKNIVSAAQEKAIRSVNFERTLMYWNR
jgi:hypothetical protein